jgi:ERF superfamily
MQNILKALILAKQEFKHIPKNSYNPYHKSKYANLDAVLAAISESFNKYNLCLLQPTEIRDAQTILKTVIYHVESGEQIAGELLLPQTADPQKTGSAITYYRRYALCSLLGIVADEDDDAELSRTGSPSMIHTQAGNATIQIKTNQSTAQNSQHNEPAAQQSRPQNIPYNDEQEKAKIIYAEMIKVGLSPEAILKIVLTKFNSTNVRSLSWEQINQLKVYVQAEGKKSQLTLNNHSVK